MPFPREETTPPVTKIYLVFSPNLPSAPVSGPLSGKIYVDANENRSDSP